MYYDIRDIKILDDFKKKLKHVTTVAVVAKIKPGPFMAASCQEPASLMKVYKTDWKTPDLNKSISKSMYIK
jgi:hypothetical protein